MKKRLAAFLCAWIVISSFLFLASGHKPEGGSSQEMSPQAASLIINEYLADPPDGPSGDANGDGSRDSTQDEFVEVVNTGPVPLDVGGFKIADATADRFTFPAGATVPPGEAAVVFGGGNPAGSFGNAKANNLVFKAGGAGLSLNNGGDTIVIKDNTGATVATLAYGSAEGNANQSITRQPDITGGFAPHTTAAGDPQSRFSPGTRVNGNPFTTTDPVIDSISPASAVFGDGPIEIQIFGSNFQGGSQARVDGATATTNFLSPTELSALVPTSVLNSPGAHAVTVQNPNLAVSNAATFTVIGPVGINEFMADPPDGPSGDANGDGARDSSQDEFVEILNRTPSPFDIGGYSIKDADAVRFTFPPGAVIPAGEAAIVFGGGRPTGEFGNAAPNGLVFTASLSLNNTGDTITLRDDGGNAVESITYGAIEGGANQSVNRKPDVSGLGFAPHSSIAGSQGRLFSPGTFANGSPFSVGPRITQIAPDRARADSPAFDMTITGGGFDSPVVLIDSSAAAISFVSPTRIIARVSASVTATAGLHSIEVINGNGNRSNVLSLTIVPPPPSLIGLLPKVVQAGAGGFTLFAEGQSFDRTSVLLVNDTPVATAFVNARELRGTVPASMVGAVGALTVRVRNGDGQESNSLQVQVIPVGPRITSVAPASAVAGGPAFTLTVRGASFKGGAAVFLDQSMLATVFVSATELEAAVPASLIEKPGLHGVSVQNPDGGGSNQVIFRVIPDAPIIFSIDPDKAVEGGDDLKIKISGDKFQPGATARVIENSRVAALLDTAFVTSKEIEAKLPASLIQVAGSVSIDVVNPDFGVSGEAVLRVLIRNPLVINEYLADPPDGPEGDANGDGSRSSSQDEFVEVINRTDKPADISGFKLSDAEAVRHVFRAGTIVPAFESVVVFGGGRPQGKFGNAAENRLVFVASSGGLSLNNAGDQIRLEDAEGRVIQEIKFGAVEGNADQSFNRDPDIDGPVFSAHARVADDGARLFSPGAKATGAALTTKPVIGALSPVSVRAGSPAFSLVVSGADFLPGAVVLFNDSEVATIYRSDAELEAEVEDEMLAEGGAAEVRVRNPKGELSAAARFLIVDDPPRAAGIEPHKTGTLAENLEIRIGGERFQHGAKVLIGSEAIETRFDSAMSITAIAPGRFFLRAAELEVRVLNADGNISNALTLAVENGPLITRLSRSRVRAGGGDAEITIGGVAFKPDITLFVNDRAVVTRYESDTRLTARIPAEMTAAPGLLTLQARHADGGRSNMAQMRVVE